jgi:hypothetical protein
MESWRGLAVLAVGSVCALTALAVGVWAGELGHLRIGMAFSVLAVLAQAAAALAWVRRG